MFIKVADYTINVDHVQHITHREESITICFAGQGGEIVLTQLDAKAFLQKVASDDKTGRFYSA